MEQKRGIYYAVGVGPGDPELLTQKALRILRACPVIAAPQTRGGDTLALDIVRKAVPLEEKTVLPLRFTMSRDVRERESAYEEAVRQIRPHLAAGRDVAMPNVGDVSLYATGAYLMEKLAAWGEKTAMVPGVPSFCAVAARLGMSLTRLDEPLHILPGAAAEDMLSLPGTKVILKAGGRLPAIREALARRGQTGALVENCGLPGERVCVSGLPEEAGYFSTVIVKEAPKGEKR